MKCKWKCNVNVNAGKPEAALETGINKADVTKIRTENWA
jgi:hypothetical protein